MSALSVNDPEDPRSHRYYAPRQRRVGAREATLQPVLERLRSGARDYSADERLGGGTDPLSSEQPEFVVMPERRFPFATLAAFAGGVTAVAALALGYVVFGANPGSSIADAAAAPPPSAQAAPAKIVARVAPNAPVSQMRAPQPMQARVATADATAAVPVGASRGDRLDAPASSPAGAAYDPLQSPLGLWSLSPTQAAIEGANPALAAPMPPSANAAATAAPPHPAAPEHHAKHHAAPVRHHVLHHVHQARHHRHRRAATTGEAVSGQDTAGAANGAGGAAQPTAAKKFMGLFGG